MTRPTRPRRIDAPTVDALRRGDPHAFEEIYIQLRGDVYNLAARIVGDRREAEDITQEVFLRAFSNLPGKADQARPDAWVFRTTVNACYDHLRRRTPTPVDGALEGEATARDGYAQAATAAAVEETLGRLDPRYRTALVLKDLHGLGNGEIAEIMGVARGTVGVLLFRARNAFKKRYREIAPTLGAGLPAAGLAVWLPPLSLPAGLATAPAFMTPLAGPPAALLTSLAPLAPVAATAAPVATGLAKLAGALTSKIAVVAIATTAVTGGGIVAYETHDAHRLTPSHAGATATAEGHHDASAGSYHDHAAPHAKTHAAIVADALHEGHGGDHAGATVDGGQHGDATGDGAHIGEPSHSDDGATGTPGSGGGTTHDGTSGGGETHTGDGGGDSRLGTGSGTGGTHDGGGSDGSGGGTHSGETAP